MTASLTYDAFAKNLNTIFRIRVDDSREIEAQLVEISEHLLSAKQERFSVVFRGPNDEFLGQGMRRLEHDELQSLDLFLVPIGRDDQGTYYEAVFNRLRSGDQGSSAS
jgi:hypothetical protein